MIAKKIKWKVIEKVEADHHPVIKTRLDLKEILTYRGRQHRVIYLTYDYEKMWRKYESLMIKPLVHKHHYIIVRVKKVEGIPEQYVLLAAIEKSGLEKDFRNAIEIGHEGNYKNVYAGTAERPANEAFQAKDGNMWWKLFMTIITTQRTFNSDCLSEVIERGTMQVKNRALGTLERKVMPVKDNAGYTGVQIYMRERSERNRMKKEAGTGSFMKVDWRLSIGDRFDHYKVINYSTDLNVIKATIERLKRSRWECKIAVYNEGQRPVYFTLATNERQKKEWKKKR